MRSTLAVHILAFSIMSTAVCQTFDEFKLQFEEKSLPFIVDTFPLAEKGAKFPYEVISENLAKRYFPGMIASPFAAFQVQFPYGFTGLIIYCEQSMGCCRNSVYELFVFDASGKLMDEFKIAHDFSQKDPGNGIDIIYDIEKATLDQFGKIKIVKEYYTMTKGHKANEMTATRTLTLLRSGQLDGK